MQYYAVYRFRLLLSCSVNVFVSRWNAVYNGLDDSQSQCWWRHPHQHPPWRHVIWFDVISARREMHLVNGSITRSRRHIHYTRNCHLSLGIPFCAVWRLSVLSRPRKLLWLDLDPTLVCAASSFNTRWCIVVYLCFYVRLTSWFRACRRGVQCYCYVVWQMIQAIQVLRFHLLELEKVRFQS